MISKHERQLICEKKAFISAFTKLDTLPFMRKLSQINEVNKMATLYELLLTYGFSIEIENSMYSDVFNVSITHFTAIYLEGLYLLLYLDAVETIKYFFLRSHVDDRKFIINSSIQFGAVNAFKALAGFEETALSATEYLVTVCQSLCYLLLLDDKDQLNPNALLVGSTEDFIGLIKKYQQVVEFLNVHGADPLLSRHLGSPFRINYNPFAKPEVANYMTIDAFVTFVCSKTGESELLTLMQMIDSQAFHQYADGIPFVYTPIENNQVDESEGSSDPGPSDVFRVASARASKLGMYSSRESLLASLRSKSSWDVDSFSFTP